MNLPQFCREFRRIEQRSIRDFGILNSIAPVFSCDPEQQILKERVPAIAYIPPVIPDPGGIVADFMVGNLLNAEGRKLLFCRDPFREDVAVKIDFFQIGKDSLPILRDRQGIAYACDIGRCVCGIAENEIGKIDKGEIINSPFPVFPGHRKITQFPLRLLPGRFQPPVLLRRTVQTKLFYVIIGIADLVHHAKCNQKLGWKISVHVCMQIGMELALAADIGLNQGLFYTQPVVLGLTHQCFGYGRNGRLEFNASVRENVCNLCPAEAQNIHTTVCTVKIAGNFSTDHEQTALILCRCEIEETGQIPDQVSCAVVGRTHDVMHPLTFHIEVNNNILFPVQIKLLKEYDGNTPPVVLFIHPSPDGCRYPFP